MIVKKNVKKIFLEKNWKKLARKKFFHLNEVGRKIIFIFFLFWLC